MFILFLAYAVGADASVSATPPRDIQQIAIDAITGVSRQASVTRRASVEEREPFDPQTAIVNGITGRDVTYLASSGRTDKRGDPQSAIVRAITGRS